MPRAVITGAGGLVGAECVDLLAGLGWEIIGIDNNLRAEFFGPAGSVAPTIERLRLKYPCYRHHALDIRDRQSMRVLLRDETQEANRLGDHICYISDLSKIRAHFPGWHPEYSLAQIFEELVEGAIDRGQRQRIAIKRGKTVCSR